MLAWVFDVYKSACTTSLVTATFPRCVVDEQTMWRVEYNLDLTAGGHHILLPAMFVKVFLAAISIHMEHSVTSLASDSGAFLNVSSSVKEATRLFSVLHELGMIGGWCYTRSVMWLRTSLRKDKFDALNYWVCCAFSVLCNGDVLLRFSLQWYLVLNKIFTYCTYIFVHCAEMIRVLSKGPLPYYYMKITLYVFLH